MTCLQLYLVRSKSINGIGRPALHIADALAAIQSLHLEVYYRWCVLSWANISLSRSSLHFLRSHKSGHVQCIGNSNPDSMQIHTWAKGWTAIYCWSKLSDSQITLHHPYPASGQCTTTSACLQEAHLGPSEFLFKEVHRYVNRFEDSNCKVLNVILFDSRNLWKRRTQRNL